MQTTDTTALKNILDYLPERIRLAIEEYSKETQLPPELVIELAIALARPMPQPSAAWLPRSCAPLERVPQRNPKIAERAIANFLDVDSVTFDDCQIDSLGVLREQNKILKIQLAAKE